MAKKKGDILRLLVLNIAEERWPSNIVVLGSSQILLAHTAHILNCSTTYCITMVSHSKGHGKLSRSFARFSSRIILHSPVSYLNRFTWQVIEKILVPRDVELTRAVSTTATEKDALLPREGTNEPHHLFISPFWWLVTLTVFSGLILLAIGGLIYLVTALDASDDTTTKITTSPDDVPATSAS
eukprot:1175920-Prorocentrum_minimum.AAC.1